LIDTRYNNQSVKLFIPRTAFKVIEVGIKKLESLRYPWWKPHDLTVTSFESIPAGGKQSDRQTDRHTNGHAANSEV